MATLTWLPLVLTFGSWKLVTPWVRMQAEKRYAAATRPVTRSSWGTLPSWRPAAFSSRRRRRQQGGQSEQ